MSENQKSTATSGGGSARYRNFATVVYPDSAPEDWLDKLRGFCIPGFVSPLHDSDVTAAGDEKKAHYHVLLTFEGKKSVKQATEYFNAIGGVGCEVIGSARGYARYLCHLDDPNKAQYSVDGVIALAGANYLSLIGSPADKDKAIYEMCEFCDRYNVKSFYLLCKYARERRTDWHHVLSTCATVYMKEYIKSRSWSVENGMESIVDPETGEILI